MIPAVSQYSLLPTALLPRLAPPSAQVYCRWCTLRPLARTPHSFDSTHLSSVGPLSSFIHHHVPSPGLSTMACSAVLQRRHPLPSDRLLRRLSLGTVL